MCNSLPYFVEFCPSNSQRSTEITCPRGIRRSVMVVTRKCNDPANKPPTHFCPIASIHGGVITGFYGNVIILVCSLDGEVGAYPGVCACLRYLYVPTCMSAIIIIHGCVHPETDVSCSSMQRRRSRLHQRKAIQLLAQVGSTVSTDS